MPPRIAIPVPTAADLDYNRRAWPQYASAVTQAGGIPVEIPLNQPPADTARLIASCQAILLPGSGADVNPQKYGAPTDPETNPADPARENVDLLLLEDAHNLRKPILAICYGIQILNVWRGGTLVQHLTPMPVNHAAGAAVSVAHTVAVAPNSLLAELAAEELPPEAVILSEARSAESKDQPLIPPHHHRPDLCPIEPAAFLRLPINSSHHQAIGIPGDGLRVVARSTEDGVVEAVESTASEPGFLIGIQWHPERTFDTSAASRALFARFIAAAAAWSPIPPTTSA
jgi:putative glutamine amidotransferase